MYYSDIENYENEDTSSQLPVSNCNNLYFGFGLTKKSKYDGYT